MSQRGGCRPPALGPPDAIPEPTASLGRPRARATHMALQNVADPLPGAGLPIGLAATLQPKIDQRATNSPMPATSSSI
jgi:hypothetical protein